MISEITAKFAREMFSYEPETGLLRWKVDRWQNVKAGDIAGGIHVDGYLVVRVSEFRCRPFIHRLAFLLVTGEWPKGEVDHHNGIRSDNRWCNLRDTVKPENMRNRCVGRRNKSGVMGVNQVSSGRWRVRIDRDKAKFDLGIHDDFFEAVCIRKSAEVRLGYHPNHGRIQGVLA